MRFSGLGDESFWMDEGYTMAYTEPSLGKTIMKKLNFEKKDKLGLFKKL